MGIIGALSKAALSGKNAAQGDIVVAIKINGAWQSIFTKDDATTNWKLIPEGDEYAFAIDEQLSYQNTGNSDVTVTDICIGVEQNTGVLVSGLNSSESTQGGVLIIPVHPIEGSPRTVRVDERVEFTELSIKIEVLE